MSSKHAYWRYHDLKRLGIVTNRMTLWRWTKDQGFPEGVMLGPNSRAWPVWEINDWLESRKSNSKQKSGLEGALPNSEGGEI